MRLVLGQPHGQPLRALALILVTFSLLFIPKFLAVFDARSHGRARGVGGMLRMQVSVFMEMLISALLAPIRMLSHTRYVLEALFNLKLKWAGQNRSGESGWGEAFLNQAFGTVLALSWITTSRNCCSELCPVSANGPDSTSMKPMRWRVRTPPRWPACCRHPATGTP